MPSLPIILMFLTIAVHAHVHGMDDTMAMGNGKRCPVCNMMAEDAWYVQMRHGQKLLTCSMTSGDNYATGIHAFSHPALLGFKMNSYLTTVDKCESACTECNTTKLLDPVSGVTVDSSNAHFLCFSRGQKLYFASKTTQDAFVAAMSTQPYYGVEQVVCGDKACPDAFQVPMSMTVNEPFCTGATVMFSGFQSTVHGTCVKLFFQSWVLDTPFKYFTAFVGVFALPIMNECLVNFRESVRVAFLASRPQRYSGLRKRGRKIVLSLLYMVQMTLAYLAMLVVMIYDTGLFFALILGFGCGYVLYKSEKNLTIKSSATVRAPWRFENSDYLTILSVDGMMCTHNCGSTVQNALEQVHGVEKVFVSLDDKCVYVSGAASPKSLLQAVEDCGFAVKLIQSPKIETQYGSSTPLHLA
ncbi:hypothetical protein THRCLA_07943 [Thraustotheca clavata]|uniref:Copper transport protein n=1 Tax=Thraustotheca clavata TaxID=74557 RepID=A0A1V9ZBQ4_9STRA|nr:hypothetical protein THRCLA_07943 [Thraustotheca clavata]